ncbi:hypothetical protein BDP27DRAFT_1338516 [Rhodocollybia butyracea]|uniref:F-box domain-containing protein n=1 Tax=Rhodocollybia butyracea TaxID=206335 RepID=A0A9P5TZ58_9AGAR|nr:hypothetical protein BDP27DRAFT_1338516 [Rhodocollybia butyracea]
MYDSEVARLQEQIMVIQAEKQQLETQHARIRSFLSPMRRLSNEILLDIFEYVCEENLLQSYPWFSNKRPLIELTSPVITYLPTMAISSVCSLWRVLALSSPSLWANIRVEMCTPAQDKAALVAFVDTVTRYLDRSCDWPLRLSLYIEGIPSYETEQPFFTSLTQHAHRWKTFAYHGSHSLIDHMTLSELQFPLLEELDIPTTYAEKHLFDLGCFKHAPRLCALATTGVPISKVPHYQLRRLTFQDRFSRLVEMLYTFPSVESLELADPDFWDPESSAQYMSRNVKSLNILQGYHSYLKLLDLSFNLPSLNTIVLHGYIWGFVTWPTGALISFISRSSCMITTFIFRGTPLSDLELIAALQVMPSLLHLEIEEYKWATSHFPYSPITSNLISSLIQHESVSISLLVPKLHTLHLVSQRRRTGTFDDSAFVSMVESRWFRPGSDRSAAMSMLGRSCIRSVVLKFEWRELDEEVYKPLRVLDKEGLRVVVAGTNGIQV